MIEIKNLTKRIDDITAINNLSLSIDSGMIYGLVGSNGAGKSTLLRILSGVYTFDEGIVLIDGNEPFENSDVKKQSAFVSDFPFFEPTSTMKTMAKEYKIYYPAWSDEKYNQYRMVFPVPDNMKIGKMSKGMQRQVALILAFASMPKYIFLDEVFDGLDPVVREVVKRILSDLVSSNGATVLIASHNLRELEDICNRIVLIHQGGGLLDDDVDSLKLGMTKVHLLLQDESNFTQIKEKLEILKYSQKGRVIEFTAKGDKNTVMAVVNSFDVLFCETLPLTLEELFINELEGVGYDVENLIG